VKKWLVDLVRDLVVQLIVEAFRHLTGWVFGVFQVPW
jgi:hypothetical protein